MFLAEILSIVPYIVPVYLKKEHDGHVNLNEIVSND